MGSSCCVNLANPQSPDLFLSVLLSASILMIFVNMDALMLFMFIVIVDDHILGSDNNIEDGALVVDFQALVL